MSQPLLTLSEFEKRCNSSPELNLSPIFYNNILAESASYFSLLLFIIYVNRWKEEECRN